MKKIIVNLLVAFMFFSCEKGSEEGLLPTNSSHRIKKIIRYENGAQVSYENFVYENERLLRNEHYEDNELIRVNEYSYEDNKIVRASQGLGLSGTWKALGMEEMIFQKNNLVEIDIFNSSEDHIIKETYEYENDKLKSWQLYNINDEKVTLTQRGELHYTNNNLTEHLIYGFNEVKQVTLNEKDNYFYIDNSISKHQGFYLNDKEEWQLMLELLYSYQNDKIEFINGKTIEGEGINTWNYIETQYTYDNNGYLVEENSIGSYGNLKTEYQYEEGSGNAKLLYVGILNLATIKMPRLKSASNSYQKSTKKDAFLIFPFID